MRQIQKTTYSYVHIEKLAAQERAFKQTKEKILELRREEREEKIYRCIECSHMVRMDYLPPQFKCPKCGWSNFDVYKKIYTKRG